MIKIALKHFIYEACINRVFDGISKNFSVIKQNMINLPIHMLEIRQDGGAVCPNSKEYRQFDVAFCAHSAYSASKGGWIVDKDGLEDIKFFAHRLENRLTIERMKYELRQ